MVVDWLTPQIAEEICELRKKEYTYSRIVEHIQDSYPSLKIRAYDGLGYIMCREADFLLKNLRGTPHNED